MPLKPAQRGTEPRDTTYLSLYIINIIKLHIFYYNNTPYRFCQQGVSLYIINEIISTFLVIKLLCL